MMQGNCVPHESIPLFPKHSMYAYMQRGLLQRELCESGGGGYEKRQTAQERGGRTAAPRSQIQGLISALLLSCCIYLHRAFTTTRAQVSVGYRKCALSGRLCSAHMCTKQASGASCGIHRCIRYRDKKKKRVLKQTVLAKVSSVQDISSVSYQLCVAAQSLGY